MSVWAWYRCPELLKRPEREATVSSKSVETRVSSLEQSIFKRYGLRDSRESHPKSPIEIRPWICRLTRQRAAQEGLGTFPEFCTAIYIAFHQ